MFRNRFLKLANAVLALLLVLLGLESCHRKTYGVNNPQKDAIRGREKVMRLMYGVSPVRYQRQAEFRQPEAERIMQEVVK